MNLELTITIQEQFLEVMRNSPMNTSAQCLVVVQKSKSKVRHC